jgi:hypothetical protein
MAYRTWPSGQAVFLGAKWSSSRQSESFFYEDKASRMRKSQVSISPRDHGERRVAKLPIRHFLGHVEE